MSCLQHAKNERSGELMLRDEKPNILFALADDLGWDDVSYHGSEIRTPNIDRLKDSGVELDQHYVCPVCTPTRTSLLTGRHPGSV
jgi:arylsulfatase B